MLHVCNVHEWVCVFVSISLMPSNRQSIFIVYMLRTLSLSPSHTQTHTPKTDEHKDEAANNNLTLYAHSSAPLFFLALFFFFVNS